MVTLWFQIYVAQVPQFDWYWCFHSICHTSRLLCFMCPRRATSNPATLLWCWLHPCLLPGQGQWVLSHGVSDGTGSRGFPSPPLLSQTKCASSRFQKSSRKEERRVAGGQGTMQQILVQQRFQDLLSTRVSQLPWLHQLRDRFQSHNKNNSSEKKGTRGKKEPTHQRHWVTPSHWSLLACSYCRCNCSGENGLPAPGSCPVCEKLC